MEQRSRGIRGQEVRDREWGVEEYEADNGSMQLSASGGEKVFDNFYHFSLSKKILYILLLQPIGSNSTLNLKFSC